jgi:hypothetical protein
MLNSDYGQEIDKEYIELRNIYNQIQKQQVNKTKERMIKEILQIQLWKILSLYDSDVALEKDGNQYPRYLIFRSIIESTAMINYLRKFLLDIQLGDKKRRLRKVLFGVRIKHHDLKNSKQYSRKAPNILTCINHLEKREKGFRLIYDELSEIIHNTHYNLAYCVKSDEYLNLHDYHYHKCLSISHDCTKEICQYMSEAEWK